MKRIILHSGALWLVLIVSSLIRRTVQSATYILIILTLCVTMWGCFGGEKYITLGRPVVAHIISIDSLSLPMRNNIRYARIVYEDRDGVKYIYDRPCPAYDKIGQTEVIYYIAR